MKRLYPDIEPFQHFMLPTEGAHQIYVEQSGNPQGIPVLFLHGGPCSGTQAKHRCFFNPERYHIILFDQRGCGQSQPFGLLEANTTQHLLEDMQRIRAHLQIERWVLFGGSWGATLALLYAQHYPQQVMAMIIRGVFLARQQDLDWFVRYGAPRLYPESYQCLVDSLPEQNIAYLYDALWDADELSVRRVTKAWHQWQAQVALGSDYQPSDEPISQKKVAQAKMELHYARHQYFMADYPILEHCAAIQAIPTQIIHGCLDFVCPVEAAVSLAKALPEAHVQLLPQAGHIAQSEWMTDALVNACDQLLEAFSA